MRVGLLFIYGTMPQAITHEAQINGKKRRPAFTTIFKKSDGQTLLHETTHLKRTKIRS